MKYSIILPCRNEEKALPYCLKKIKEVLAKEKIKDYEIIVSDSSQDKSPQIAKKFKAKLVKHDKPGYGNAYLEAFKVAKGNYLFLADADSTYEFEEIPKFLKQLESGYDFVIGDRFSGGIQRGAMPFLHRYVGNPLLSSFLRLSFKAKIRDSHCGMRAITRKALKKLDLKTTGMEFASEMVIKAVNNNLKIKEVPINYLKRKGQSKLNSFSDGWRHLRFMLMYAPNYLFLVPGLIFLILGLFLMVLFLTGPVEMFGIALYNRPIILGSFLTILGYQIISLNLYTKAYMKSTGFIKKDRFLDFAARWITLELGILIGATMLLISLEISLFVTLSWISRGFPELTGNSMLTALTLGIIGIQTIFSAFFLSILLVEKRGKNENSDIP